MQSKAKTVSAYLKELPENRKAALNRLQEICRDILVGYEEDMDYGMPCYKRKGVVEIAFASQKNYVSLYILKQDIVKNNQQLLQGLKVGKSCIRYPQPDQINFQVVQKLLSDTINSKEKSC
ncbi:DUF1801 domain-containing protein [soil metagenome]